MGCATCAVSDKGVPTGCGNKGHCAAGTCNMKNSFDWLSTLELHDPKEYNLVEVSFKKGARKEFYIKPDYTRAETGDMVVVEAANGYDIGRIGLSGELVRIQMKKKKVDEASIIHKVIRVANMRDLQKLNDVRSLEKDAMIRARKIVRTLDLDMKVGDVEYQGDKRKATFYYTADGRVDFRELVRMFAKEFRIKIEMRQIGSRQESSRIGGLGTCGRELCCSTWKSDFQSVTTTAARYQNLAINQTKLTGQCGRLKCCLNYELDMYKEAVGEFPLQLETIPTEKGLATIVKIDIFKGLMYYNVVSERFKSPLIALTKEQVWKIKEKIDSGQKIGDINELQAESTRQDDEDKELDFEDVTGVIELPAEKKSRRRGRRGRSGNRKRPPQQRSTSNRSRSKKGGQNQNRNRDSGSKKNNGDQQNKNNKRN